MSTAARLKRRNLRSATGVLVTAGGTILLPVLWIGVKYGLAIPDRFLPSLQQVAEAAFVLDPPIYEHALATYIRAALGLILGTVVGIGAGLYLWMSEFAGRLLLPSFQTLRVVPAIATVPFFLLWFGFSETGKIVLVTTTIGFNLAVATHQALLSIDEKYVVAFRGFKRRPQDFPLKFGLPFVLPTLLPTVRYSIVIAIGVIIVSELLGSQVGLGYLIQTSRSTFSMHVVMLATILLGILSVFLDWAVRVLWRRMVFWRRIDETF